MFIFTDFSEPKSTVKLIVKSPFDRSYSVLELHYLQTAGNQEHRVNWSHFRLDKFNSYLAKQYFTTWKILYYQDPSEAFYRKLLSADIHRHTDPYWENQSTFTLRSKFKSPRYFIEIQDGKLIKTMAPKENSNA